MTPDKWEPFHGWLWWVWTLGVLWPAMAGLLLQARQLWYIYHDDSEADDAEDEKSP